MADKDGKIGGSVREKTRPSEVFNSELSSSTSDFASIMKLKKDRRPGTVHLDTRPKSLKKEKKDKKEKKRLSDTDPPHRHSSGSDSVRIGEIVHKNELNVSATTRFEQPTKLAESAKLDHRYYRKSTDVECQIVFYDENLNPVIKLIDSEDDVMHWESILQKGGGSSKSFDTLRKQKKYLSSIASVYEREVSESKYGLLRYISENILRGTKKTYLSYLVDLYTISVTYTLVTEQVSQGPPIIKHRLSVTENSGVESLKILGHRRSQSVANRGPPRRASLSRIANSSEAANYSSMPHGGIRSPLVQVNGITQDEPSSGNSSKGGTGISHTSESSSSKYNTLKEEDDQLQYTLENLLKEERFIEAKECIRYMNSMESMSRLNSEYEKAKSEDNLDEAILIRNKIKNMKDIISTIQSDPTILDSWNGKPSLNHKTLQQIHEYIIDRVGTKLALPFIEEFADVNLYIVAKEDIEKAIALQKRAIERLMVLAPPLSEEEEREKKKREEEERWRKEAEEKKKKKKKERESTLRALSETTSDLLSDPTSDPVIVPILDNHK